MEKTKTIEEFANALSKTQKEYIRTHREEITKALGMCESSNVIYEIYYSLEFFRIANYYSLNVEKETPQTFRGTVSDKDGKSVGRFALNKEKLFTVYNGSGQWLRTHIPAQSKAEAMNKARQLFADFLSKQVSVLKKEITED